MKGISKRASVVFLSLIFLLTLVSAMPVEAKVPLRWEFSCNYSGIPTWTGEIIRDDGIKGDFYQDILVAIWMGNVQHFSGVWWIDWDDGGHIEGTQKGSFTYAINQYTVNGWITETSSDWSHLDGRKIHTIGIIDWSLGYTEGVYQIN